jgi:hypothetical protein
LYLRALPELLLGEALPLRSPHRKASHLYSRKAHCQTSHCPTLDCPKLEQQQHPESPGSQAATALPKPAHSYSNPSQRPCHSKVRHSKPALIPNSAA